MIILGSLKFNVLGYFTSLSPLSSQNFLSLWQLSSCSREVWINANMIWGFFDQILHQFSKIKSYKYKFQKLSKIETVTDKLIPTFRGDPGGKEVCA